MAARVRVQQGGAQGELRLRESEWGIGAGSSGGAGTMTGSAGNDRQQAGAWAATLAVARESERRGTNRTGERGMKESGGLGRFDPPSLGLSEPTQ